jgi:hypothetical protein
LHKLITLNEMITKLLLVFLAISIVLNSAYGRRHLRTKVLNSTIDTNSTTDAALNQDDYYDYYDYVVTNGYNQQMNKNFLYPFSLFIIVCLY